MFTISDIRLYLKKQQKIAHLVGGVLVQLSSSASEQSYICTVPGFRDHFMNPILSFFSSKKFTYFSWSSWAVYLTCRLCFSKSNGLAHADW